MLDSGWSNLDFDDGNIHSDMIEPYVANVHLLDCRFFSCAFWILFIAQAWVVSLQSVKWFEKIKNWYSGTMEIDEPIITPYSTYILAPYTTIIGRQLSLER